ncbi:LCP family protein [Actinospica sp. MGRD01-02]|uniref:LCP family protein n=1 Tax=Actinospica acidithermotolerans TaxID=2828514 RepID=A0A941EHZ0_9ACTN|nr:LCP family protein [Actinospica acidithermotolerans]MBR7831040.1 LCP family protein [Actinospica acidithermotolerans]
MADPLVDEGPDGPEPVPDGDAAISESDSESAGTEAEAGAETEAGAEEPEPEEAESEEAEGEPAGAESEPEEAEGERSAQRARRARRRRRLKTAALAVTATTALGAAAAFGLAAWDVQHLTKNLKHTALLPSGFTEPAEPVDAYGRSPINILLIGSDTRATAADCGLGGDCGSGANADSEMIVHLSADRSNVTVLSIPRDTETELPECAGGDRGMVNSALQYGASCQVAAVVKMTGITIDHYMMFDFSGVVDLSSELGGVPVCVSASVHDPYSGLTISGGTSNVEGKQALQFLRTRHAFYDGSDLGREEATHIFLSSLLRKVKASATLTNLSELQSIAETVTQYTTVDNGLDSATALLSLADDFGEVDADRTTFLTMPWQQDTDTSDASYQYRVEASSDAQAIFQDVEQDKSFTTSGGSSSSSSASASAGASTSAGSSDSGSASTSAGASASGSATASSSASASATKSSTPNASEEAAARKHPMHVNVVNASGTTNRYETVVSQVFRDGFVYSSGSDATSTRATTTLVYSAKEASAANELAGDLNLPSSALEETGTGTTLVLTIGTDWTSGATYSTANSSYSASAAISVPSDSYEENGANAGACVTANPDYETGSGTSGSSQ